MKRRTFGQVTGATLLASHPLLQWMRRLASTSSFEMELLRGNVGYFTERGGTIGWMIGADGVVVVDAQFPAQAQHLIEEIRKESQSPIEFLINTHHHGDHTAGNIAFKGIARRVLAHENSKKNQENSARARGNLENQLLPDMTFTDKWSKKVSGETITMEYWGRAHTDGDAITHFENANVVHLGDLVFNRRYPYIDKGAGALISNWISVLDRVKRHFDDETIFITGHARDGYSIIIDKDDITAFAHYLGKVLEFVGAGVKRGKSDEEILKATAIPGAPEWQGEGIQRSLNAAIVELREGK